MFSNARPVPSKAALKVLYQLAYISSGTAAGIATLCAEERRRRTQVVQKIADNAKRIKQSPQHVRNRRRRSADEIGEKQAIVAGEDDIGAAVEPDERVARAPDLPSAVENGYAQIGQNRGQKHKRLRRSSKEQIHENLEEHVDRTASNASRKSQDAPRVRSRELRRHPSVVCPDSCQASSIVQPTKTQRTNRELVAGLVAELKQSMAPSDHREGLQQPASSPQRRLTQHHLASIDHTRDIADTVVRYVRIFHMQNPQARGGDQQDKDMAITLLRLSATAGLHGEAYHLLKWLAKFDAVTPMQILMVCESCRQFLRRSLRQPPVNNFNVLLFYRSLFEMPIFTRQEDALRVRAQLAVIEGIASVHGRAAEVQTQIRKASIDLVDNELLVQELAMRCQKLRADDEQELGLDLLFIVLENITVSEESAKQYEELVDRCIGSAIAKGKLGLSVHQWVQGARFCHDKKQRVTYLGHRLNHITRLARQKNSYDVLLPICRYLSQAEAVRDAALEIINDECKASLAMACSVMDQPPIALLEQLQNGWSLPRKNELVLAQAHARLKQVWQSTRSLPAVFAAYKHFRKVQNGLLGEQLQFDTILHPEQALVEICNLAGQPDRGLQILSRTHTRLESTDSFSLAALTLATEHSWELLETLVSTAVDSRLSIASDSIATHRLNHAVFKYGERHSAAKTWNFVSVLVSRIGFVPSASTAKSVLQKLVSEETPDEPSAVLDWLQYMRSIGADFELNSATVVKMFRSHYRAVRTPHALLMHFCRRLLRAVPFLKTTDLQGLVKEAIAYDMRVTDTLSQRRRSVQFAAEINLKRVMEHSDFIPLPIGSKKLRTPKAREDYLTSQAEQSAYEDPLRDAGANRDAFAMQPSSEGTVRWEPLAITLPEISKHAQAETESAESMAEDNADLDDEPFERLFEDYYADEDHETQKSPGNKEATPVIRDASSVDHESHAPELGDYPPLPLRGFEQRRRRDSKQDEDRVPSRDFTPLGKQKLGYAGYDSSVAARQLASDMILAFSMKKWEEVLDLYWICLGPTGRPPSPLVLNVAVQARIRLDGGEVDEAKRIMSAAQDAGFNASCALAPILIREMRTMPREDKQQLSKLRDRVLDYYKTNKENGWPVSQYVGVTAANLLIDNHVPALGIDLLNFICQDKWGSPDPPSIVAMTVFLKGFKCLKHLKGIGWVVHKVLTENMHVTHKFLAQMKDSPRAFEPHPLRPKTQRKSVDRVIYNRLKRLRALCARRRSVQRDNARRMGFKFVAVLRRAARFQLASTEEERQYLVDFEHNYYKNKKLSEEASANVNKRVAETYVVRRARSRRACISRASFRKHWLRSWYGKRQKKKTKTVTIAAIQSLRAMQYRQFIRARRRAPGGQRCSFKQYIALKYGNGMIRQDLSGSPSPKALFTPLRSEDAEDKTVEQTNNFSKLPGSRDEFRRKDTRLWTEPALQGQGQTSSNPSSNALYTPLLSADAEGKSVGHDDGSSAPLSTRDESQRKATGLWTGPAPQSQGPQNSLSNPSSKFPYTPLLQEGPGQALKGKDVFSAPLGTRDEFRRRSSGLSKNQAPRCQVQQNSPSNASSKAAYTPLL
ncbi:hypothetical protein CERZMDRAFT_102928 [Cercospora zeae-maydis SCOH1-5]|uniref:Uncharacterized protein n=1 Tax=Cercospora zeae-maydis SCOH1-5 TaxID=717836 RepID=A0A6A6EYT0_9PEZI|nr:hypothetical protein CERZMDRAFT_102928 [Cercospora zeae-maydis SCOH1-5]